MFQFFRWAVLIAAVLLPVRGNGQTGASREFRVLVAADTEMIQLGKDITQTVRAMSDKTGVQYACISTMLTNVAEIGGSLSQYKFSIGIRDALQDSVDLNRVKEIVKIQTNLMQIEAGAMRESTNQLIGTCSKFPLVVTKGQALLNALSNTESALKAIASQL